MCLGGGAVPQAPNTSAQQAASSGIGNMAQSAGQNQLNWATGQVANNSNVAGQQQAALSPQTATDVGANAAGAGAYGQTLGALGNQLQTAQQYGNTQGMNQASANAEATTQQAMDAARQNNMRQLGSYGVDPSQMKSGALNLNANLATAGAVGNAGYQAGQQRQLTGMGLVSNALNQNLMGSQVGQGYGAGANATGSTVANIGNQTTATGSQALSAPSQMFQTGLSGYGTSANIANQTFGNQLASYNASQAGANALMGGIGQGLGMAGSIAMAADGGAIPGRRARFADGGSASVPVGPGVTPVMSSAGLPIENQASQQNQQSSNALMHGIGQAAMSSQGGNTAQANAMLPQTNSMMAGDPSMQALQNPTFADGGQPGPDHGDPNTQRKRFDYGNPAVQHNQQPMAPPLVNIPGPWVGANGGQPSHPGPGMIQHGPSDGTGIDDQVHARVSVGEYIIPADVVHAKGKEFFDQLLKKYHMPAQQQRQQMGAMH